MDPYAFDANYEPLFVGDGVGLVDDPEPWDTYEVAEVINRHLVRLTTLGPPLFSVHLRLLKDSDA